MIIYISVDWERKNGDKAIDVCRFLTGSGIRARLILIGKIPEHARHIDFVDYRGFLSKSDPAQLAELCRAYRESHFLLVLTVAEAFGIVFSEAQAFGVPPIAHDVGGTGSAIVSDDTGLLLPLGASPEMFAEKIMRYVNDSKLYDDLSQRCRDQYLQRANWLRWSALILQLNTLLKSVAAKDAPKLDRPALAESRAPVFRTSSDDMPHVKPNGAGAPASGSAERATGTGSKIAMASVIIERGESLAIITHSCQKSCYLETSEPEGRCRRRRAVGSLVS